MQLHKGNVVGFLGGLQGPRGERDGSQRAFLNIYANGCEHADIRLSDIIPTFVSTLKETLTIQHTKLSP